MPQLCVERLFLGVHGGNKMDLGFIFFLRHTNLFYRDLVLRAMTIHGGVVNVLRHDWGLIVRPCTAWGTMCEQGLSLSKRFFRLTGVGLRNVVQKGLGGDIFRGGNFE